jgi:hypothetical protein
MVWDYWSTASVAIRQRIRVVVLGSLAGFGFPAIFMLVAGLNGSQSPVNYAAFTLFVFPLSIGYVLVTADLLRVEMLLRRSVYSLSGLAIVVFFLGIDQRDSQAARSVTQQLASSSVRAQSSAPIAQDGLDSAVPQSADSLLIQATLLVCRQDFLSLCPRLRALDKRTRIPVTFAKAAIAPTKQFRTHKAFSWSTDNMK